jgi:hypothetical protein
MIAVALPPNEPTAVTVYAVIPIDDVGVPETTPVLEFIDKPVGNAGLIEYDIVPAKYTAVYAVVLAMAVPVVPVTVCVVGVIDGIYK